jgi:hypothetical protein
MSVMTGAKGTARRANEIVAEMDAAEKYWLTQAQRLIEAFTKATGHTPVSIVELNEWAAGVSEDALKAIADGEVPRGKTGHAGRED